MNTARKDITDNIDYKTNISKKYLVFKNLLFYNCNRISASENKVLAGGFIMRRLSHKVIAMLLSMIMLLPYLPMTAMADGENTAEITIQSDIPAANNSVSGYVSTTNGQKLVG